jgi:hypothetical protein
MLVDRNYELTLTTPTYCKICRGITDCQHEKRLRKIRQIMANQRHIRWNKLEAKRFDDLTLNEFGELLILRAEFMPPASTEDLEL